MNTSAPKVEDFSLDELHSLRTEVEHAIRLKQREAQKNALDTIARLVKEARLTPEQVMQHISGTKKKRGRLPVKYRDPDQPEHRWAGRGKKPRWIVEKLASGAQLEDFRIQDETT